MFKYPKTFQCNNGSEFKSEVTKLLEKHNVKIRRAIAKYKHTHTTFVEAFSKELAKLLFKPMDAQELQKPEKVSTRHGKGGKGVLAGMRDGKSVLEEKYRKSPVFLLYHFSPLAGTVGRLLYDTLYR